MYARLNPVLGWQWSNGDNTKSAFVLSDISRYAGMISGTNPDATIGTRPVVEFDALSQDGITWVPVHELLALIPWEKQYVRGQDVSDVSTRYPDGFNSVL